LTLAFWLGGELAALTARSVRTSWLIRASWPSVLAAFSRGQSGRNGFLADAILLELAPGVHLVVAVVLLGGVVLVVVNVLAQPVLLAG